MRERDDENIVLFGKEMVIVIGENMPQMEYEPMRAIAKQLTGKTENKPRISNTKKIESFKYGIYFLIFAVASNSDKMPAGKGVRRGGRWRRR